jgi:hypothetical protein
MQHSARRINALTRPLGATRYLEIGVLGGQTFREVEVAQRTGVDPDFKFEVSTLIDERTRLVSQTSDEFFANEPLFPPYDLLFIDGMHTFEQVSRDFCNAIVHSHRRSVILIDDTLPNDVYSTNPNQADGMRYRRATGNNDIAWHGDVFKLVFLIHDFWPSLDYRTIVGSGNPQTMVWRANNIRRTPRFDNFERISRLTYFDLQENLDVLQKAPEDEAIAACIAAANSI